MLRAVPRSRPTSHVSRLTVARRLSIVLFTLAFACTRPPASPSTALPLYRSTAPSDCDAPPIANQPEGCADDAPRPANAGPVDRPGVDREGDTIEDILDACPDQPEDVDGDRDDDGCPDPDTTQEIPTPS